VTPRTALARELTTRNRILVVDDDPMTRHLFETVLARAGYDVVVATSGAEALAVLEREVVDIVLLDNHMPGMTGIELLPRIRERAPLQTLPIILVTGDSGPNDTATGLDSGADDYLAKPVDVAELTARVRAQLRGAEAWRSSFDRLRTRVAVAEVLVRVASVDDAEMPQRVCETITEQCHFAGAAVISLTSTTGVRVLGTHGVFTGPLCAGELVVEDVAARLRHVDKHMPRIASRPVVDAIAPGLPSDLTVAMAPLFHAGELFALLLLAEHGEGTRVASSLLAAAIDFSDIAHELIATRLARAHNVAEVRANLRAVVAAGAFEHHFQPIYELASRAIVGYEALCRWDDGTRPDLRFRQAHALGIGGEVELATLRVAFGAAAALPRDAYLTVNVAPSTILESGALAEMLPRDRAIVLEVTEHEAVDDYDALRSAVARLGDHVQLAVDDAGAGYASLRHIFMMRPALVKLDLGWIRGIDADPARQAVVAGLVHCTHELSSDLVAEGIETEAELRTVRRLGVVFGQGFLLGRPAPAPRERTAGP
jgi:EAL domain-containing protein (putative c-di-GMP-specific phosphodiesterase class I)/DNA-binding response OmpR family regulator